MFDQKIEEIATAIDPLAFAVAIDGGRRARAREAARAAYEVMAGGDGEAMREVLEELAKRRCEAAGPEDLESGCCLTCRARSLIAQTPPPSSNEGKVS